MPISYHKGDATRPIGPGIKVIAHVCNDIKAWGAGFVLSLNNRWDRPKIEYMNIDTEGGLIPLGTTQFVPVEPDVIVANMVAQHGIRGRNNPHPLRMDALEITLGYVMIYALERGASVHMPRIGSGLAGGDWNQISALISKVFANSGLVVNIYDL